MPRGASPIQVVHRIREAVMDKMGEIQAFYLDSGGVAGKFAASRDPTGLRCQVKSKGYSKR